MFHKLQFMSSILKNKYLPSNKKYMEIQRREMSKFIIFMVLGGAAALVYANMGTLLQYAKKSILAAEATNPKLADILPTDAKQNAVKYVLDSMSIEEKKKLYIHLQKELADNNEKKE